MQKTELSPYILIILLITSLLLACASLVLMLNNVSQNLLNFEFLFGKNRDYSLIESTSKLGQSKELSEPEIISSNDESKPNITPEDNLALLESIDIPQNNILELATRLKGISQPPVQLMTTPQEFFLGDSRNFWSLDVDKNEYRNLEAELRYKSANLYFWVEKGIDYDPGLIDRLADTFETRIYPTNREFFGSEWIPGVDNDPHFNVLFANGLGRDVAGYFSSTDSIMPEIERYSNSAEMVYISAENMAMNETYTYGVLAHEFQHIIHWNLDRNEPSWVNEGFSELASDINGFKVGGHENWFALQPDLQLNFWPGDDQGNSIPHYGASYLFMKYFLNQFGVENTQKVVAEQLNGFEGFDSAIGDVFIKSEMDGFASPIDNVFQNWTIANYLQDNQTDNGIYGYGENSQNPQFFATEDVGCNTGFLERTVNQYGTDYISISCDKPFTIQVNGSSLVNLLPVDPYSSKFYLWSNKGDESHMTLNQTFDFRGIDTPINLKYQVWFDLERDYDYVYLTASEDGDHWQIIQTPSCTTEDPTGANYGCGYNGKSEGWVEEIVDISQFAGKEVTLQFEYITDAAVNGEGLLIDDFQIDALDYFSDFEVDSGGWMNNGFVRVQNHLPQNFGVSLVKLSDTPDVLKFQPVKGEDINIQVENPELYSEIILIISGMTRLTQQNAMYQYQVTGLE